MYYPQSNFQNTQPPVGVHVQIHPQYQYLLPTLTQAVINDYVQRSNSNPLRAYAVQFYGQNNWNNPNFTTHLKVVADTLVREHMRQGGDVNTLLNNIVAHVNQLSMGQLWQMTLGQVQIDPTRIGELQTAYTAYNRLLVDNQNFGNPAMGMTPMQPMQPFQGNATAPGWVQAAVVPQPTTQPTSGFGVTAPTTTSGPAWKRGGTDNTYETPVPAPVPETTHTPAPTVAPIVKDYQDWVEVEDNGKIWHPTKDGDKYPLAVANRYQKRTVYRNQFGQTKQEITTMDYNSHQITSPLTHAQFEQKRLELYANHGKENVTDEDVRDAIIRHEPVRAEFGKHIEAGFKARGASLTELISFSNFVRFEHRKKKEIAAMEEGKPDSYSTPDVIMGEFVLCNHSYQSPAEADMLIASVNACRSWSEVATVMRRKADYAIAEVWNTLNTILTQEINDILHCRMGIQDLSITDFTADFDQLPDILKEDYGDLYCGKLISERTLTLSNLFKVPSSEDWQVTMEATIPWVGSDIRFADVVLFTRNTVFANVFINSFDLEFELEVGQARVVTYDVSQKMRTLADDLVKYANDKEDIAAMYVYTRDGALYQVFVGTIDESVRVYKRVL